MSEHDPKRPAEDGEATPAPTDAAPPAERSSVPSEAELAWLTSSGDAFIDDDDDDDLFDDAPPRRGGLTMRHPLLLVLVLAGASFMFVKSWPKALMVINADDVADCGDLTERPVIRRESPEALPALDHDTYCGLFGVVENRNIYATGEPAQTDDIRKRDVGRKYFLKLNGDNVFGIVAADREDVLQYRLRKGSLLGFVVKGPGRMIDPAASEGFDQTERFLRSRFRIDPEQPLRLYDTTDDPKSRWPYLVICALMLLTGGLALFGLVRIGRQKLAGDDA